MLKQMKKTVSAKTRQSAKLGSRSKRRVQAPVQTAARQTSGQLPPLPQIVSFIAAEQPAFQISASASDGSPANCFTMLGDPEKSTSMAATSIANARSLSSSRVGVVYPLYFADDPFYQATAGVDSYRRASSSEFVGIAGLDRSLYMLGPNQSQGSLDVSGDVWTILSADDYPANVPANRISTVAYVSSLTGFQYEAEDIPALSSSQFFCEVPQTARQDFSAGKLLVDAHLVKNFMDGQYQMRCLSSQPSAAAIANNRRYVGIGSCGSKLYLAYRDDVDVSIDGVSATSRNGTCGLLCVDVPLVEIVDSMRRTLDNGHEPRIASLYSIDVTTQIVEQLRSKLAGSGNVENTVAILEAQIRKDISNIATACSPAQLQLFDVLLNGKPSVE